MVSRLLVNVNCSWGEDGANHLLFTMFPGSEPLTSVSKAAILAAASFSTETYRQGFHIPFISFSPEGNKYISKNSNLSPKTKL
jgi:hypothetical protein